MRASIDVAVQIRKPAVTTLEWRFELLFHLDQLHNPVYITEQCGLFRFVL
jgi:hypothetical protein